MRFFVAKKNANHHYKKTTRFSHPAMTLIVVFFIFQRPVCIKRASLRATGVFENTRRSRISILSHGTQIPGKLIDSGSSSCSFYFLCIEKKRINTSESAIARVWPAKSLGSSSESLSLAQWAHWYDSCKEIVRGVLRGDRRSQRGCLVHTRHQSL